MDKVYIDGDTADGIVVASLKDSMDTLRMEIKRLKSMKNTLSKHGKEDLADSVLHLDAMEKVFDYYGGNHQ